MPIVPTAAIFPVPSIPSHHFPILGSHLISLHGLFEGALVVPQDITPLHFTSGS